MKNHILLTTFPQHKSQNVGDNLICHSALQHIKFRIPNYSPKIVFRETSLDGYSKKKSQMIVAPGLSISDGTYPRLYALFSNLNRLKNFYPIGCSFQHVDATIEAFTQYKYGQETIDLLKRVNDVSGDIPCRDMLIVDMLKKRNIGAVYSGDMAIYDEDYINTDFTPPKAIKSIVFTIQHHLKYFDQSKELIGLIAKKYPDIKLHIAYHSKPGPKPMEIAQYARDNFGYEILHQYGGVENLERYNEIDLHIGYRLHGHITFLRKRKPSILLVEDARSYGLSKTKGTHIGTIDASSFRTTDALDDAPERVMEYLARQTKSNFGEYKEVFNFIDKMHKNFISPYFDELVKKL